MSSGTICWEWTSPATASPDLTGQSQCMNAQGSPLRQPAVLVLSLPRSGSSWVGGMLGGAPDARYLREPVTQSDPSLHERGTTLRLDVPGVEESYRNSGDRAFAGMADFPERIVIYPEQWSAEDRTQRRVVVKEVNPFACGWYLERYAPRLIFLVRHPAAVALSYERLGWQAADVAAWRRSGTIQAEGLATALDAMEGYSACLTVVYEDLCARPLALFQAMYDLAGLTLDDATRRYIDENSRESARMIDSWRGRVDRDKLEALQAAYCAVALPWYQDASDWT